jgi:hypothetical protein
MSFVDPDQIELLRQARGRAAKLVEGVRRQRDELLTNVPAAALDPESLAAGRAAMDKAVASAEQMLAALESALAGEVDNPE